MPDLIVIEYDDMFQAEEVRLKLLRLQREYLIDLEDAVVAVKDAQGHVKLHQIHHLSAAGAVGGGFWGALIGLIFMSPVLGLAVGAAAGAVSGALTDVGIQDEFMRELASTLEGADEHGVGDAEDRHREDDDDDDEVHRVHQRDRLGELRAELHPGFHVECFAGPAQLRR